MLWIQVPGLGSIIHWKLGGGRVDALFREAHHVHEYPTCYRIRSEMVEYRESVEDE